MAYTKTINNRNVKFTLRRENVGEYLIKIKRKRTEHGTKIKVVAVDLRDKERVIYPVA